MRILSVRGKITTACAASEGYDVELVLLTDNAERIFLHLNAYDGEHYSVSKTGIFDYMTGQTDKEPRAQFIEEYNGWSAARKSPYKAYFAFMRKVLDKLG